MKRNRQDQDERQVANLQLVKETNKQLVFDLIYNQGPLSRAELAKITRLSPTTVSSLTGELFFEGVIEELGAGVATTSGRKPILLDIRPEGGYIASFELLESGFELYLYDIRCGQIAERRIETDDFKNIGSLMSSALGQETESHGLSRKSMLGICVGIPALLDEKGQKVISSTVIQIEADNNFVEILKKEFYGIPVEIKNESSLCAYAERVYGAAGSTGNLVAVDINIGIGAGIIINNSIFNGSFGLAGEIGHTTIDINGPRCKCGSRGCLEVMAGIPAIKQKILFGIMSGRETLLKDLAGNEIGKISMDDLRTAYEKGDLLAIEVMEEEAALLAAGLNNIINIVNPETLVISGEIIKLGDGLLKEIKSYLNKIALKPNIENVNIRYTNVKGNPVTLGGARYMLERAFRPAGSLLIKSMN